MYGFGDNEVFLQDWNDVIVIYSPGGTASTFFDWFWKSDHNILIVFHSKFLSDMHGFRDNEILLQTGYDVIVISPTGGAARNFWIADAEMVTPIL